MHSISGVVFELSQRDTTTCEANITPCLQGISHFPKENISLVDAEIPFHIRLIGEGFGAIVFRSPESGGSGQ